MESSRKPLQPKLDKSKIRLLICADTERGRTPYFDSNAIRLVEASENNDIKAVPTTVWTKALFTAGQRESAGSQHRQAPKYHFQKLGSDVKVLGEMMFGTVAMAFRGSTVKVHLLRSPTRLMVSKVFSPDKPNIDRNMDAETYYNGFASGLSPGVHSSAITLSEDKSAKSIPVDVPTRDMWLDPSTEDDSGLAYFSSSGSLRTSLPSPSNGSYSSLHRRWMRAQTTSLNGYHKKDRGLLLESSLTRPQRNKLAVGIIFGSNDEKDEECDELFQSFFFSHFALIEGHVDNLRGVVEKAYFNSQNFLPTIMEALEAFRNDLFDLYMAPRLLEPMWLTMTSATTHKNTLSARLMETFMWLVTNCETKSCKFFVSSLLSAVLTHHLAWVATVIPADVAPTSTYLDKYTAQWIDTLTKSHPYNPLWAQLGDLFGAISYPRKISRTIVIGRKANIVKRMLCVLSYFIRCSEVQENTDLQCLNNIVNDFQYEAPLSQSPSVKTLNDGQGENSVPITISTALAINPNMNSNSVNVFANNENSFGESLFNETRLGDINADSDSLKRLNEPVSSPLTASTVDLQNHRHLESQNNSYNKASSEGSCEQQGQEVSNLKSSDNNDLVGTCECDKVNAILNNNIFINKEMSNSFNSDISISQLYFFNNNNVSHLTNNSYSSVKSYNQSSSCAFSSAEPMGMSELNIYTPSISPCSVTSAKLLEPYIERAFLVGSTAPDINHTSRDFVPAEAESISNLQSLSASKIKSRLTQQLGEDLNPGSKTDNRLLTSAAVLSVSIPEDNRKEIDSKTRISLSKQTSQDSQASSRSGSALARNRSLPGEFNRRRHLSSSGSTDYEPFDPSMHCVEIKIPDSLPEVGQWHVQAFDRNFGHSLMADYTDHYMPDFVLLGTSDTNCKPRLLNDLQVSVRYSVLDEPIDEAVSIIADTDNWTVEVASSKVMGISPSGCTTWTSSQLVANLIASVIEIFKLKMSAEFCLMHLEDKLQEIYFKGVMLSEKLRTSTTYSQKELLDMLGCTPSDMPLLLAVAGAQLPSFVHGMQ